MMKYLSGITTMFSAAALLDALGLETKRTAQARALTYAGVALGGVAIGAVAALMLAPKSGRELRSDVVTRGRQLSSRMASSKMGSGKSMGRYDQPSPGASTTSNVGAVGSPEGMTGI